MLRTLRELFRITPARPAVGAGVRAGLAAALPLLLAGAALPLPTVSWLSLGAFQAVVADRGGAYRSRAAAMASIAVFSSMGCILGSLLGGSLLVTLPATLLLLFASGLAQAGGATVAGAARSAVVSFLVAHARPAATLLEGAGNGLAVGAGALASMLLALALWPVRHYLPARRSIARAWEQLATQAHLLATSGREEVRSVHAQRSGLRSAIEEARGILAATRGGRQAEDARGEKLLRLLENADQILGACVAIDGWREGADPSARARMAQVLATVESTARAIARRILARDATVPAPVLRLAGEDPLERRLVARLANHLAAATEVAMALDERRPAPSPALEPLEPPATPRRLREVLRGALDRRSVVRWHALRLAIAGGVAAAAVEALGIERGYWITLTVVVVLQPWSNATLLRGVQRIAGTAIGALLAVLALGLVHDRPGFAAVIFTFCSASVALLPLNYGAFSVLLTPAFILLAELATGDFGLAWVRVLDTLLGGGIALLAALVLWPRWERQRFPDELARAMRRSAAWLQAQSEAGAESLPAERARREAGIAVLNLEASLQRLLSEPFVPAARIEALLVLTLYFRRIHATALAVAAGDGDPAIGRQAAACAAAMLREIADCVAEGLPPQPSEHLARLEALADRGGPSIGRLVRQLAIVQNAARRAFSGGAFRLGA